ncbi:MAG TPA: PIG-L family deacetylase [Flavobacterium sp.]|nr:PIG-L family deacetylase [Flavobacterium sp.]
MKKVFLTVLYLSLFQISFAQKPQTSTPSEIYTKIEQLNVLATAMYIAAHPDDENTRLITYLTHHEKAHTDYLSLTRGNGGQNLLSNELGSNLGVIRTNELWNARKTDGGHQFFSTADDFGFSKHPREAFAKWNKESLLQQIVYMIRKEQPDIIINRFDHRTEGNTHGHHTASAQLSKEALALAQDESFQPPISVKTWKPTRLFFNVSWFFFKNKEAFDKADKSKYIPVNIGVYYNQLGKNNQEIASLSRSQHQSQGFGDLSSRGDEIDYVELIEGEKLNSDNLFEGIDTTWNRIEGGEKIKPLVEQLLQEYDFKNPANSIALLTKIYTEIDNLPESIWKERKQKEVRELIKDCAGLFLDATTNQPYTTPNENVIVNIEIANRSNQNIVIKDITLNNQQKSVNKSLANQAVFHDGFSTIFGENDLTNFKFINTFTDFKNQFEHNNKNVIGLEINGTYISFPVDIQYRYKDAVKGEVYQPFHVVPRVSVAFKQPVYLSNNNQQNVAVVLDNYTNEAIDGTIIIDELNESISKVNSEHNLSSSTYFSHTTTFSLLPNEKNKEIHIDSLFGEGKYAVGYKENISNISRSEKVKWIDYEHIPLNYYIEESQTKIVHFDNATLTKKKIGYIMGAGDEIPQVLENVGYQVDLIDLETLKSGDLYQYETVIVGIRAFNTQEELTVKNQLLFDYAKNGGTVIVQYQTNQGLKTEKIAPYHIQLGKTRITDENAKVDFIHPEMSVLNRPFQITENNFKNWIQEQGLYYADDYAKEFKPILSSHDFNEKNTNGALLIASHGKGYYIYTGLSFFRQLPAGNVGVLELFINLIEMKND